MSIRCNHFYFLTTLLICSGVSSSYAQPAQDVAELQNRWAIIYYQEKGQQQQGDFSQLADQAAQVTRDNPDSPPSLIWQAIIISTKAQIEKGLDGLHDATHARDLLLSAERIDPTALNGVVYTALGVLYYKVPGWPIGFGNNDRAREYLDKGLKLDPDGLDSNFFYGDFLYETGDYAAAKIFLRHGLNAAPGSNLIADHGRRNEINMLLEKISD